MAYRISVADVRIGWTESELDSESARPGPPLVKLANPGPHFYVIGPNDGVAALFDRVLNELGGSTIELLTIYAHGYVYKDAKNVSHGGYGVAFGKDDITIGNAADLFGRFKGKFVASAFGIELVGCRVAETSRVKVNGHVEVGDGSALCRIIAGAAGTCVRASKVSQVFHTVAEFDKVVPDPDSPLGRSSKQGRVVDPGAWEGNTWVICKDGPSQ